VVAPHLTQRLPIALKARAATGGVRHLRIIARQPDPDAGAQYGTAGVFDYMIAVS
jgi:hypothetical protein